MEKLYEAVIKSLINEEFYDDYKIIDKVNSLSKNNQDHFLNFLIKNKLINIFFTHYDKNKFNFKRYNLDKKISNQINRYKFQQQLVIHEVLSLQKYFNLLDINAIFLKGVPISFYEYKKYYLRPMVDIDVLIQEDDIYFLTKYLLSEGYKFQDIKKTSKNYSNKHSLNINKVDISFMLSEHHHIPPLIKNNISIEIHSRVTSKLDFTTCPLTPFIKSNLIYKDFYGTKICIPSPEALLLHQATHFSINHKFFCQAISLIDIVKIIEKNQLEISALLNISVDKKIKKSLTLIIVFISLISGKYQRDLKFIYKNNEKKKLSQLALIAKDKIFSMRHNLMNYSLYTKYSEGTIYNFLFKKIFVSKEYIKFKYHYYGTSNFKIFLYYLMYLFSSFVQQSKIVYKTFTMKTKEKEIFNNYLELDNWLN